MVKLRGGGVLITRKSLNVPTHKLLYVSISDYMILHAVSLTKNPIDISMIFIRRRSWWASCSRKWHVRNNAAKRSCSARTRWYAEGTGSCVLCSALVTWEKSRIWSAPRSRPDLYDPEWHQKERRYRLMLRIWKWANKNKPFTNKYCY